MNSLMKSTIISIAIFGYVNNSFASLEDCLQAGNNGDVNTIIKTCKPYASSSMGAIALLAGTYGKNNNDSEALKYSQMFIDKYKPGDDKVSLSMAYTLAGNYYYFGQGASKDTQKGLEYLTKGAELGNATAQYQLGSFYGQSDAEGVSKNFVNNYYWETLSKLNGETEKSNEFNFVQQNYDTFKKQYPYCIALGQDNVGQAYYQGIGGLTQSNSNALDWMQKAADTDPTLSVTNLDLAKMYHINGDDDKAFEYAQKATSQPLAQAMQYIGTLYQQGAGTDKDPVKAYAYLTLAVDLYNNPDKDFWDKFAAPCMPNYQGTTKEFNVDVAKQQLEQISINDKQKEQANKLINQIKSKLNS